MDCKVIFEKATFNGKEYENVFLDFGHNVRVEIRDYNARDKLALIKSIMEE